MSYAPKAAGHDDASIEQRVVVEQDLEIEALVHHVAVLKKLPRFSGTRVESHLRTFFLDRERWNEQRVKRALRDQRVSFTFNVLTETGVYPARLLHYLPQVALDLCADVVFEDEGEYRGFEQLGYQPTRVLVNLARHPTEKLRLGLGTNHTMYLLSGESLIRKGHLFDWEESLVVDLGVQRGVQRLPNDSQWQSSDYISREHRSLSLSRTGHERHLPRSFTAEGISSLPRLSAYLDTLFTHCEDPHSLHRQYGPTPGPTIREELRAIIDNYSRSRSYALRGRR